ncbi:hypothetical protein [Dyadobacter sp. 3J3]|uniref:hypothetical protein n=1 Tax=Dyadobacter sp. 3J3 TaxID=2606600 RepID=UPI00135C64EF|nr:hypothetical protein [Dyadobacter sp. 3J3]
MKTLLKEEFIKFWFGLISTAAGVLVALVINSGVERRNDHESYQSMIKAINIEAAQNEIILEQSFCDR